MENWPVPDTAAGCIGYAARGTATDEFTTGRIRTGSAVGATPFCCTGGAFVNSTIASAASNMANAAISMRSTGNRRGLIGVSVAVMEQYANLPSQLSMLISPLSVSPIAILRIGMSQHGFDRDSASPGKPRYYEQPWRCAEQISSPAIQIPLPCKTQHNQLRGNEQQDRATKWRHGKQVPERRMIDALALQPCSFAISGNRAVTEQVVPADQPRPYDSWDKHDRIAT